ncbi:MAG: hypothetical protein IJ011_08720 [Clostridia bacterium]|nr:hypothetical protein [Clostridia bacterium]
MGEHKKNKQAGSRDKISGAVKASERKNEKKKVDKGLVIAIVLCVAVALGVVGFIFLPEPIAAAVKLNSAEKFIANSSEYTVVLNAPMELGGILNDSEAVMRDADASDFVEKLSFVLENVKYSDTTKAETGVWKTKIVIYNTTDETVLYIDADGIYIENNGKLIKYRVTKDAKTAFDELYTEINSSLN